MKSVQVLDQSEEFKFWDKKVHKKDRNKERNFTFFKFLNKQIHKTERKKEIIVKSS